VESAQSWFDTSMHRGLSIYLRITVGTPEDNGKILAALARLLGKEMH